MANDTHLHDPVYHCGYCYSVSEVGKVKNPVKVRGELVNTYSKIGTSCQDFGQLKFLTFSGKELQ